MVIHRNRWAPLDGRPVPSTLAHEFGHCFLNLEDEYEDHCGHIDIKCTRTIMGEHATTVLHGGNLCHTNAHRSSTNPAGHVCATCSNSACGEAPGEQDCGTCATGHSGIFGIHGGNPAQSGWHKFSEDAAWEYVGHDTDPRTFADFEELDVVAPLSRMFVPMPDPIE